MYRNKSFMVCVHVLIYKVLITEFIFIGHISNTITDEKRMKRKSLCTWLKDKMYYEINNVQIRGMV